MGDVPPKEGDGVGKIRGTSQVTVFRLLFPSVPMKWQLSKIWVYGIFGYFGALRAAPEVRDG